MKTGCRIAFAVLSVIVCSLSGCSLLPTTRKLPIPREPLITQTVVPEELVAQVNQRWAALDALTATVEIQATLLKSKEGVAKDYPSCRGFIVMRKPGMLRVMGQYFGVRIFDMASDGSQFTLLIPSKNKAIEGSNAVQRRSTNEWENMRPGFFFDSMVVRGLDPGDEYMVTADTETVEDVAKKHLFTVPEYVLNIMRPKPGSHKKEPVRVVTFHRDDMLPYQQDLYDGDGNLETDVLYSNYQDFGSGKYPAKVTIMRPLEGIQIVMTVERVTENPKFPANEFEVKLPEGTQIQNLQ